VPTRSRGHGSAACRSVCVARCRLRWAVVFRLCRVLAAAGRCLVFRLCRFVARDAEQGKCRNALLVRHLRIMHPPGGGVREMPRREAADRPIPACRCGLEADPLAPLAISTPRGMIKSTVS